MSKALAKSNKNTKILLVDHSKRVSENCIKALSTIYNQDVYDDYKEIIRLSGLLHDIGKATTNFQKKLKNEETEIKSKFLHNEIGWAFLYEYLDVPSNVLELIINSVYWHHGIINKMCGSTSVSILNLLGANKDKDIDEMKKVLVTLCGSSKLLSINRSKSRDQFKNTPAFYIFDGDDKGKICVEQIIRNCLICSDRLTSISDEQNTTFEGEFKKRLKKNNNFIITDYKGKSDDRFIKQLSIKDSCEKTTIIKAPAGFGKTVLGLLWASKSDNKLIWVCPRNTVTESIYDSIISELDSLNINNVNVELFYASEVKKRNFEEGTADIIVTNIDNFLAPTVDNSFSDRLFLMDSADVVFDEYHELVTEAALFSLFITIMKIRSNYSNANTLLLSATPTLMHFLWQNEFNAIKRTKILPSQHTHYKAVHNNPYAVFFDDMINVTTKNSLVIMNSVSNAQTFMNQCNCDDIIHSKFTTPTITNKLVNLFESNGKYANINSTKNVMGTLIIQACLDVSFRHLYEVVFSPEGTLQRVGRCDRFGNLLNSSITFCRPSGQGEITSIANLYDTKLNKLWYDYLEQSIDKSVTLDELYTIYNDFNQKNEDRLVEFIKAAYSESLTTLTEKVYPVKRFNNSPNKTDKLVYSTNSNKFRSKGNEMFYIAKIDGTDLYSDPISTRIYNSVESDFSEINYNTSFKNKMFAIESLVGDVRFNYDPVTNIEKYGSLEKLRYQATRSDTPYIRQDVVYHPTYGFIKKHKLEEINNQ
jgi:CRISPR-associated endonuclease Cas3-HD